MCKCTPGVRTPYCGKLGCEWPDGSIKGRKMKTKLYRATIEDVEVKKRQEKQPKDNYQRDIYIAADSVIKATNKLVTELSVSEELANINIVSEECYV